MAGEIVRYRPVTNLDRVNTLDTIVDAVAPVLRDLGDRVYDYPGFIESSEPRSLLGNATRSVARANCRIWAAADKSEFSPRVNAGNAELCGPYLESIGENPGNGSIELPFNGGQCPVGYFVRYQWNTIGTGGEIIEPPNSQLATAGSSGYLGPIQGIERQGGAGNSVIVLKHGNGIESILRSSSAAQGDFENVKIIELIRADSAEDSCGDPTPIIRPPNTIIPVVPQPPTINIELPGVGPVDVNIELDVDGAPVICIPILGACKKVEVDVDVDGSGGGTGGGGGAPPFDPEIGPPSEVPPGSGGGGDDTGFGEPPEGRIWVGAYVQLLGDLTGFGVIPRDLPGQAALPTVVGNACLNVQGDSGLTLRSTFTQIRSEWSEHIVPVVGLTVSGIRVKVNPVLGYRVYPVSVANPLAEST